MRKLSSFILALALAVVPFGGAAFAGKGPEYTLAVSKSVDGSSVTATAEVKKTGEGSVRKVEGKFVFKLKQGRTTVAKKEVEVKFNQNTTKASTTFEDVKPGFYKVEASFSGKVKLGRNNIKHVGRISNHSFAKVEAPQPPNEEPGDGDGDDNNGDGDNNGDNNGGNDDQNGDDNNNGQQPGGNGGKGDDNGDNNGKDGSSGTIQNPGSGNNPATGGKLPKTATSLPLNAMLGGLLALAGGTILFARRLVG